jgi:protein O-mannosyl-transferase
MPLAPRVAKAAHDLLSSNNLMVARKDKGPRATPWDSTFAKAALLIGITVIVYIPALRGGFVWDDDSMLTGNPLIHAADGLHRFWFTTEPTDYWPITYTALWLEWRLWGMDAVGYHAVSVALHGCEAVLLWAILRRMRVPGSFLAALLFAVHPVNVESVAWITQQKNLLAMMFFLASVLFFLRSDRSASPGRGPHGDFAYRGWYGLSLLALAAGMLCKGSIAMLPFVLLGLIAWHRRLAPKDVVRIAPFFLTAAVFALVDIWFQHHGSTAPIRDASWIERILGAGAALCFYFYKAALPLGLMSVYPQWSVRADNPLWWLPLLAAAGITLALWRFRRRGSRPALFAWGYFVVMLVPALGLTDVYFMRYSLVADHYQHLALIGVVALAASGLAWGLGALSEATIVVGRLAIGILIIALAALTWRQCEAYSDIETFYQTALERNPSCWMAENNLGGILILKGDLPDAIALIKDSLVLEPRYPEAYYNLGLALFKAGHYEEAAGDYGKALELKPLYPEAHYNLGLTLADLGRKDAASAEYGEALRIKPEYAEPHNGLGLILAGSGRMPEAIAQYEQAIKIDATNAGFHQNLGTALSNAGLFEQAIAQYEQALQIRPDYAEAHNNLGVAWAKSNRVPEATAEFEKAVQADPGNPAFRRNLGAALQGEGRADDAREQFEKAAELQSNPRGTGH